MKLQSSANRLWVALGIVACGTALATWSWRSAVAQPAAAPAPKTAPAAAPVAADAPIVIPQGDAAALDAFIQEIAQSDPADSSQEGQVAHAKKVLAVILEASARMLKAKPTEEQQAAADTYRLMALQGLSDLGDEKAAKEFGPAVEKAMTDPRQQVAAFAWQSYLVKNLQIWPTLEDDVKKAFAARILERVKTEKLSPLEVKIVYMVASNLDHVDDEFTGALLKETVPLLRKGESEEIKAILDETNLEGMLRRLTLMGQPMEVSGDLLGGGKIDWKSYRGKVVLVDFSATWCPPCMEELPNVIALYEKYKSKGFEVITVSLDQTPEAAEKLVKEKGIKWATLYPEKEDDRYLNHPLARYYGIVGIPTAILLDKDGKAVNLSAYADTLRTELERLLDAPPAAAPPAAARPAAASTTPAPAAKAPG